MTPPRKFKRYAVDWTGRMAPPGGRVCDITIKDISKGGALFHFSHALPLNSQIKIEIHAKFNGENMRLRAKALVLRNDIFSQNRGAAISVMFTQIGRRDAHSLNNILHFFENGQSSEQQLG